MIEAWIGDSDMTSVSSLRICTHPDCDRTAIARGLCSLHYQRAKHAGLLEPRQRPDTMTRFNAFVPEKPEDGCWLWAGYRDRAGYGRFYDKGLPCLAYRMAYTFAYGPIPEGKELDHMCHNAACVRPDHLQPVTRSEHLRLNYHRDGQQNQYTKKTHCPAGHLYAPENTYVNPKGYRKCRACRRAEWQRWNARRKEQRRAYPTG